MLTDQGLCRTINAQDINDLYVNTEFMDALTENIVANNQSIKGYKIKGRGSSYSVRLVVDVQEYLRGYMTCTKN